VGNTLKTNQAQSEIRVAPKLHQGRQATKPMQATGRNDQTTVSS